MSSSAAPRGDDDPWLAPDKLQHVAFCFSLACAGFFALASVKTSFFFSCSSTPTATARQRLLAGALLAFLGGSLKELGDFCGWWPGRASLRDAAADVVGAVLGLAACALFESSSYCRHWRLAREWTRRRKWLLLLKPHSNAADDEQRAAAAAAAAAATARSRGEYRGLELSSSSAEV